MFRVFRNGKVAAIDLSQITRIVQSRKIDSFIHNLDCNLGCCVEWSVHFTDGNEPMRVEFNVGGEILEHLMNLRGMV